MKILLDTHFLIWALDDGNNMPKKAKDIILDENNTIYFSVISLLETAIKHLKHPDQITYSCREIRDYCVRAGFEPITVREHHVFAFEALSRPEDVPPHKDPFDKMLIAQAKAENMYLLTSDKDISLYSESCIISV